MTLILPMNFVRQRANRFEPKGCDALKVAIIYFTENGENVAEKIKSNLDFDFVIYKKGEVSPKNWIEKRFFDCNGIIFIGAVGIAVRFIAPLIKSKDIDPAVVVIDDLGRFVIPILSGHLGGGNDIALELSEAINALPIITTATDINGKFAVDVWSRKQDCVIDNIENIKFVSAALLRNQEVFFDSDFLIDGLLPEGIYFGTIGEVGIKVSLCAENKSFLHTLNIIPKIVVLGIGCRKNTDFNELERFAFDCLNKEKISFKSIKAITSIDVKKNESALLEFERKYNIPFIVYSAKELSLVKGEFNGSEFVKKTVGVDNVCERSSVLCSKGDLILRKQSRNGITLAISMENWRCKF